MTDWEIDGETRQGGVMRDTIDFNMYGERKRVNQTLRGRRRTKSRKELLPRLKKETSYDNREAKMSRGSGEEETGERESK